MKKIKILLKCLLVVALPILLSQIFILKITKAEEPELAAPLEEVSVISDPQFSVSKTVSYDPETQKAEYVISWSINEVNIKNLEVTDVLPDWTEGIVSSIFPAPNPVLESGQLNFHDPDLNPENNRTIHWNLGDQEANSSGELSFTVEILAASVCKIKPNIAAFSATYGERNIKVEAVSEGIKIVDPHCDDGGGGENKSPIANAGPDQSITLPTNSATLDGSGSTDPDGQISAYEWTFVSGPTNIDPDDTVSPVVNGLVEGVYVFELKVKDNKNATGTDSVVITVNPGDGTGGGGGGGGGGSGGRRRSSVSSGQVLGSETRCGIYIDKYLRVGYNNDPETVKKLQNFLNYYIHSNLVVDGIYGKKTEEAVRNFQLLHKEKILNPWGINNSTGIFYLTTQAEVNNIMCPTLELPIPSNLINWSENPNLAFSNSNGHEDALSSSLSGANRILISDLDTKYFT